MWGMGVGGGIGMLVVWGLLIAGIVFAVRWFAREGARAPRGDRALELLRERYARGGIDREEFEARRRQLE